MLYVSLALSWLAIGGFLQAQTQSRGLLADMVFVATWPLHLFLYLVGKDR